jgi:hypothetical protein
LIDANTKQICDRSERQRSQQKWRSAVIEWWDTTSVNFGNGKQHEFSI